MKIQQKKIQTLLTIPLVISFLFSIPVSSMEIVQNCLNYDYELTDMCTECKPGYFVSQTQNICIPCPEQCPKCPDEKCIMLEQKCKINLSNGKCDQCFFGNYLSKNKTCQPCQNHCSHCITDEFCLECQTRFYLNPDGLCKPCQAGCGICSNEQTCLYCTFQYFLSKGECYPCIENCLICSDEKTCKRCLDSYQYKDNKCQ